MKNHLIYQDNDIKVEILGEFHKIVKRLFIQSNRLSEVQFNILMKCIFSLLEKNDFPIKDKKVISCSLVPIIYKNKIIEMTEMFDDFNFAFQVLINQGKMSEEAEEIINEHYAAEDISFFTKFFKEPIYNVSGFFAMIKENNLLITLFTLDENFEDFD